MYKYSKRSIFSIYVILAFVTQTKHFFWLSCKERRKKTFLNCITDIIYWKAFIIINIVQFTVCRKMIFSWRHKDFLFLMIVRYTSSEGWLLFQIQKQYLCMNAMKRIFNVCDISFSTHTLKIMVVGRWNILFFS